MGHPRAAVGREAVSGLPLPGVGATATAPPSKTQAGGGGRGPGPKCGGDAVICLLLCGRRNLTLMLITYSVGTTTKIIQQTSVHIALVQVLPLAYFFITFSFKGNSRPNLYRRVKFVSRNAILGNLSIEFFSCKISSRSGMWEKCCQGSSQRMHSGGLRSL